MVEWFKKWRAFGDSIYVEINVNRYSPSIYNSYFNNDYNDNNSIDNYSNGSDNVIDDILVNKLEIKCKENMECTQQKKFIDFGYVNPFDYIFTIITMIDLFKDYIDTILIDERLKLISRIVVHLERRKNRNWRALIGHAQDQGRNNLNLRINLSNTRRLIQEMLVKHAALW